MKKKLFSLFFIVILINLSLSTLLGLEVENKGTETFIINKNYPVGISIEHYKEKDGWTPIFISVGRIEVIKWINSQGIVTNRKNMQREHLIPLFNIYLNDSIIQTEEEVIPFEIIEQDKIRTRLRIEGNRAEAKIRIDKNKGKILLFSEKIAIEKITVKRKNFLSGGEKIEFICPYILSHWKYLYDRGFIYRLRDYYQQKEHKKILAVEEKYKGILDNTWIISKNVYTQQSAKITSIASKEREALIALYNSTDGDNWTHNTNWKKADGSFNDPVTEGTWYGVTVENDHVVKIDLYDNNLNGKIPSELEEFNNLTHLCLYMNKLTGNIPLKLFNLTNLQDLELGHNQLSGNIPSGLGNLPNLKWLLLDYNQLEGDIPTELAYLTNLIILDLAGNKLTGNIGTELGYLNNLVTLHLHHNQLTGTIPPELGNLTNLQTLGLQGNQLTGSIPSELGNLINLNYLTLEGNKLTGSIPPELGNLTNLRYFFASNNQLSGNIPLQLGNLINLINLYLCSNQLEGSIPSELGNLANLETILLYENKLTGSIPPELGNLTNLEVLCLSSNQLTGSIPSELGMLSNLTEIWLYSNQLTGSIPPELGNLTNLEDLVLSSNQLTGSIPPELGNLANLETILLYENKLTGSIPPELGNLANLENLFLSSNQLTGSIPSELGMLSNLTEIWLYSNQLTGSIPPELGNLTNLEVLCLYSNKLKGSVPPKLEDLTNLDYLDLCWNALYTNNTSLINFLNDKQWNNFGETQTIAPTNLSATASSSKSIKISWEVIKYTSDGGGYKVFYSTSSGGPWTEAGMTQDKTVSEFDATSLNSNATYYFVVKTQTDPHSNNDNMVLSEYSEEVSSIPVLAQHELTISATSGGTTNPNPGSYSYDEGTEVIIEAKPNSGYLFDKWTGNVFSGKENNNPISIVMDGNKSITANFALIPENQPPIAKFEYFPKKPWTGVGITFDARGSEDPDGKIINYKWEFGDGFSVEGAVNDKYVYSYGIEDTYLVRLTVTDDDNETASKELEVPVSLFPDFIIEPSGPPKLEYANLDPFEGYLKNRKVLYEIIKRALDVKQADLEHEGNNKPMLFGYMNLMLKQLDPEQISPRLIETDMGRDFSSGVKIFLGAHKAYDFGKTIYTFLKTGELFTLISSIPEIFIAEAVKELALEAVEGFVFGDVGFATIEYDPYGRMEIVFCPKNERIYVNTYMEKSFNQIVFISIPIEFKPLKREFKLLGISFSQYIRNPWYVGMFVPPEAAMREPIPKLEDIFIDIVGLRSPGELRIYDSKGNVTGLVNGKAKEEIPDSQYVDGTVVMFSPLGSYQYEVVGTENGTYGLDATSIRRGKETKFNAVEADISVNSVHEYTIDWDALSRGEPGVTINIDYEGDGTIDQTITTGSTFTLVAATLVIEKAKIDFKKKSDDDKIHVNGKFKLATDSVVDISEDVIVTIGLFSETINMTSKGKGDKWEYKRTKGKKTGIKDMKLDWKKGGEAKFDIHVDKADLGDMSDWTNPVTITILIGDDLGSDTITMKEHKHHWDY